jgi:hypothetical protein
MLPLFYSIQNPDWVNKDILSSIVPFLPTWSSLLAFLKVGSVFEASVATSASIHDPFYFVHLLRGNNVLLFLSLFKALMHIDRQSDAMLVCEWDESARRALISVIPHSLNQLSTREKFS